MDWLQSVVNYKVEQFEQSTLDAFHKDEFYRALPPRLQVNLVEKCLYKHNELLEYFFCDSETGYQAS